MSLFTRSLAAVVLTIGALSAAPALSQTAEDAPAARAAPADEAVAAARASLDVFIHTLVARDDFDFFVRLRNAEGPWRRAVFYSAEERLFIEPPDLPAEIDDEAYGAALIETPLEDIADWAFASGAAIAAVHGGYTLRLAPEARISILETTVLKPPHALQPLPTPEQIRWHADELEGLRRARDIAVFGRVDAAMNAAKARGAATIDHFLERRAALGADAANYAVKLHVAGPDTYKWLTVDRIEGDLFHGR
ncbi:MAG: hypothetical protein AAGM38_10655 [Pseudomonadota bacterium]